MERTLGLRKERERAKTLGVVIFIKDDQDRVYTAQELETDKVTGKEVGDYSVICEKRKSGESWPANMMRAMEEETGIPCGDISTLVDFGSYRIWETQFKDCVWSTVIVLKCSNPDGFMKRISQKGETDGVKPIGFLPENEFRTLKLRDGVRTILDNFGEYIFTKNEKPHFN